MTEVNAEDPATRSLDGAIGLAATFLRAQLRSGDYGMASLNRDGQPTYSDNKGHIFVAAHVAEAMSALFDEVDRTIVLVRILSEETDGLWGYSTPGPRHIEDRRVFHVDADDSAFALRTLRVLGVNRPPERLLQFHRPSDGVFATFDAPDPTFLTTDLSPANTLQAHPEVNANVFLALEGTHFDGYIDPHLIARAQHELGFWKSYFYPSPLYGTLLALDLLQRYDGFDESIEQALSYVASTQEADGSWGAGDPYETALAVSCLAGRTRSTDALRRGVRYLLSTMAENGSWASPACIWQCPLQFESEDLWRSYDRHGTYVTARCLTALRRAAPQLSDAS